MSAVSLGPAWGRFQLVALVLTAGMLYAPFVPRFFWGDDWFWLEQACLTRAHWGHCWGSSAFGYWRPLFVLYLTGIQQLWGPDPIAFGIGNILFHATNCGLFWGLLRRLKVDAVVSMTATLFLASSVASNPVVLSISAWPDLWVVASALLFGHALLSYLRRFSWKRWISLLVIFFLAIMGKETAYALVPLFFVLQGIHGPGLAGPYRLGAFLFLASSVILLILSLGHVAAAKNLTLSPEIPLRLWVLVVQLLFPLPKRLGEDLALPVRQVLGILRLSLTLSLPVVLVLLFRKDSVPRRLFLLWPILFLAPVSVLPLQGDLLALYPDTAVTRYLYAATPGLAFWFGRLLGGITHRRALHVGACVALLFLGWMVTTRTSARYRIWQNQSLQMFQKIETFRNGEVSCRCVHVESTSTEAELWQTEVLVAMSSLAVGRRIPFSRDECGACWMRISGTNSDRLEISSSFDVRTRGDSLTAWFPVPR